MPLFGDLSVGTSGLKLSQYGLNVVAHNLANVDTEGYVRQQTVLETATSRNLGYNAISPLQIGLGVDAAEVRQVRDFFLDKTYRTEVGRQGYYDSQANAVQELEDLFGELQGVAFQDTISDLWVSMQELSKESDSRVAQATFIETATTFLERADKIHDQMLKYQLDLNTQIENQIDRINEIGKSIDQLNKQIAGYEAGGIENANDLRDQRNLLLDELAGMVKVDYQEHTSNMVTVSIEGVPFVTEDYYYPMGGMTRAQYLENQKDTQPLDECADILMAVWPHLGNADVFDWSSVPCSSANTDIGGLKGAIQARGTKVGKYTDIPLEPKIEDYTGEDGTVDTDAYKLAQKEYSEATMEYNLSTEASVLMRTEAQFDQLVHGIVTMINDCLCPNKEVMVSAGTTIERDDGSFYTFEEDTMIKIFDSENAPVGTDENSTAGVELFTRKSFNRYMQGQELTLADGTVIENALIYNWEDDADNYSLYTLGEIEINPELLSNKSKLPIISNDNTGDYDIAMVQKMLEQWQEPFATLSPNTLTYNNFEGYYTQLIGSLATKGDECRILADNQDNMVRAVEDKRQGITAVSSDEELTYLIRFQHAYNASARYINVVDKMLEHLIERLG